MISTDIDFNNVKALLGSVLESNQRIGLALLSTIEIPKDNELAELMCNTSNKITWCQEFGLEKQVTIIKLDHEFGRRNLSIAPFVNLEKIYFNRQNWTHKQVLFRTHPNIKTISLTGHRLYKLPKSMLSLKALKTLYLGSNQLIKLPSEIGQLAALNVLILSKNRLKSIPSQLMRLKQLTNLNIANNQLKNIPTNIGSLQQLETLNLSYNRLEEIPASIGQLRQLKTLNLSGNKLVRLPNEIQNLIQLERIQLYNNPIRKNKNLRHKLKHFLPNTEILFEKPKT